MANQRTKLWDTETSKFQDYPPRQIKPNRVPIGLNSKNIDNIFGTNVAQNYGEKTGYSARKLRTLPLKPLSRGNPQKPPSRQKLRPPSQSLNSQEDMNLQAMEGMKLQSPQLRVLSRPTSNRKRNFNMDNSQQKMMTNFLIEQINSVEKNLRSELKKAFFLVSAERERSNRIETNLRLQQENKKLITDDLQDRINNLETRLAREESQKGEFIGKVFLLISILIQQWQKSEGAIKQIQFMMRNFQQQESEELQQMREILQNKVTTEQSELVKEREKSKALFFEVVRLGEQSERQNEIISNVNLGLETRLQSLESQLQVGNRAIQGLNQKGETGLGFLNEWNDKLEKRMQTLEANLYSLSKQQQTDKDIIARVEKANNQITEDLKMLLESLSNDYESRLDNKVQEMVNKIILEHEERIKSQDELKNHVDFRDKVIEEKQQYEREEMRDRYMAMDSLVRAEFQRKDEAIKSLQGIFETQVRSLQTAVKQEETARNQFEAVVRGDFARMQEALQKEYGFFKKQQSSLTEKITEMIKVEIDTRLSSDVDLKNLTNMMATGLTNDISMIKETMEIQNKKFAEDLKHLSQDTSEKANSLSRYTDVSCKKVQIILTKKYDKLKGLFSKIAMQFKMHLVSYTKYQQDISVSIYNIEEAQSVIRKEMKEGIEESESKLYDHVKETKSIIENMVTQKSDVLKDLIQKVKEQQEGDVDILKKSLQQTHETLILKTDTLNEQNDTYHKNNYENMKQVIKEIDEVNGNVRHLRENFKSQNIKLKQNIQTIKAECSVQLLNEKAERNNADKNIRDLLDKETTDMKQTLFNQDTKLSSIEKTIEANKENTDEQFNEVGDTTASLFNKLSSTLDLIAEQKENVGNELNNINTSLTIQKTFSKSQSEELNSMIIDITQLFGKTHEKQKTTNGRYKELIKRLNNQINGLNEKLDMELDEKMDQKIQQVREQIKSDQNELWKDSVKNVEKGFDDVGFQDQYQEPQVKMDQI